MERSIIIEMTDKEINGLNLMRAVTTAPQSRRLIKAFIFANRKAFKSTEQYKRAATTEEIMDEIIQAGELITRCNSKLEEVLGEDFNLETPINPTDALNEMPRNNYDQN